VYQENDSSDENEYESNHPYAGRWVAYIGDQLVGQGGTPRQALEVARATRFKENPTIYYVPLPKSLVFSPLFEKIRQLIPAEQTVYLVGGAVRDAILGIASHDLDFVLSGNALRLGRKTADALHANYFPLDGERNTARVILTTDDKSRHSLDFATFRAADLENDLAGRDFTINAIAVELSRPQELLDPLGGVTDLKNRHLRVCAADAFENDPLRILRGVRLASDYQLRILPDTRRMMKDTASLLPRVSIERVRDELFRILDSKQPTTAIQALDYFGLLPYTLPELQSLKGVAQSAPHIVDVWEHTLATVRWLYKILDVLGPDQTPESVNDLTMGLLILQLGRYRKQLAVHLASPPNINRPMRALLTLAALYHDAGKPAARQVEGDRVHFYDHEKHSAALINQRGRELQLSNEEIDRLEAIILNHMRIHFMANRNTPPTRRTIYRFFRATGTAGVDVCVLTLADLLATYGPSLQQDMWNKYLEICVKLLEAWWEKPEESVAPPPLLSGNDLQTEFGIPPGPEIGKIKEGLREAQATREIITRDDAIRFVHEWLEKPEEHP
jgi:poly(A) polymerase